MTLRSTSSNTAGEASSCWRRRVTAAALGAALLAAAGAQLPATFAGSDTSASPAAVQAVAQILHDTVPAVVADATNLGAVNPSTPMTLIAPLALSHPDELASYVNGEYTAGSANYHQFLSPAGFAAFFGASGAHVTAATQALSTLGFTVAPAAANHLYLKISGTVGLVEQVFSTTIDTLRLPTSLASLGGASRTFTANVTNVVLPAALDGLVTGLIGLDSLDVPHSNLAVPTPQARAAAGSGVKPS